MNIEERVRLAFDLGQNNAFLPMLAIVLPAVEASAQKSGEKGRQGFLNFVRRNYDILQWFTGSALDFTQLIFPALDKKLTDGKEILEPDLAMILYHVHRCALAHGQDISENFGILPRGDNGLIAFRISQSGGYLNLPEPIAWGLVAAVVLDPINSDIATRSRHYFNLNFEQNAYFLNIDLFWGEKSKLVKIASRYKHGPDQTAEAMARLHS